MAELTVRLPCEKSAQIVKWNVRKGAHVMKGTILALYKPADSEQNMKLKCNSVGTVHEVLVPEGATANPGESLVSLSGCSHPTVMKDMCAECGADLREALGKPGDRRENVSASVAMVHSIPELIVSQEQALELGKEDEQRLLSSRKLVLLVDLDQTLIHTTNENVPPNLKDVFHFQLWHGPKALWYHTKLRPGTEEFLDKISQLYELHICTFGARMYAHTIAGFIDPNKKYFSHRILSRDECFNPSSKTANLKALFPRGDAMVCIIDDREDVWSFSSNLVHVRPYIFFEGTADINAPPGAQKGPNPSLTTKRKVRVIKVPKKKKTVKSETEKTEKDANLSQSDVIESVDLESPSEQSLQKTDSQSEESSQSAAMTEKDANLSQSGVKAESGDTESQTELSSQKTGSESEKSSKSAAMMEIDASLSQSDVKAESGDTESQSDQSSQKTASYSEKSASSQSEQSSQKTANQSDENSQSAARQSEQSSLYADNQSEESSQNAYQSESASQKSDQAMDQSEGNKENGDQGDQKSQESPMEMEDSNDSSKEGSKSSIDRKEEGELDDSDEYEEMLIWEDEDDYLQYLTNILERIHTAYYQLYDVFHDVGELPSLRNIIPYVRRKTLKGCNILFSGVIPTNMQAEKHRLYVIAKSLGANVHATFVAPKEGNEDERTTHVIARGWTAKAKVAKTQYADVAIVNPNWLWACYKNWEKVSEMEFILDTNMKSDDQDTPRDSPVSLKRKRDDDTSNSKTIKLSEEDTIPLPGDNLPQSNEESSSSSESGVGSDAQSSEGKKPAMREQRKFSETYNPLYTFSDEDIAGMDKEVEDLLDEEGSDSDSEEREQKLELKLRKKVLLNKGESSDEDTRDSLSGNYPHGWGKRKSSKSNSPMDEDENENENEEADDEEGEQRDMPHRVFKHTSSSSSSSDNNSESDNESIGSVDEEMAAAVERDFLNY